MNEYEATVTLRLRFAATGIRDASGMEARLHALANQAAAALAARGYDLHYEIGRPSFKSGPKPVSVPQYEAAP